MKVNSRKIQSENKIFDNPYVDVTNKSQHSERNLLTNFPGNNGVYNYNTSEKSKIEVERDIRAVQDEEFRKSLEAEKICRSRH